MLSQGMLDVYQSVWAETAHYDTGMLESDEDFHVCEDLILHEGRLMSMADYESLR